MLDDILETRVKEKDGHYHLQLMIPQKSYNEVYDHTFNLTIAADILTQYLEMRGDDGKPADIQIRDNRNRHTVEIEAELEYVRNEHTDYVKETGHFFTDIMNQKDHDITYDQKHNR